MLLWIWLGCLVAALWLYFRQAYSMFRKRQVKTDTVVPLFGTQLKLVIKQEHGADNLQRLYDRFADEKFFGVFQFVKPLLVVKDIELIKRITVKDFEHFLDHRTIINEDTDPLFGRNLFSLRGTEWKDMRSTLSPAFTSSKMKQMLPLMAEVGDQMILSLKNQCRESGNNYVDLDAKDLTTRFANDVIASCAFGLKVDSHMDRENKFYEMGKKVTSFDFKVMLKFLTMLSFPQIAKLFSWTLFEKAAQDFFRRLVLQTMETREQKEIVRPDMIHLLMQAKKGKLKHEEKAVDTDAGFATVEESDVGMKQVNREWSDDDLAAQAILFLVAGFETISSAMTFMLYELALNLDVQEKLYQEICENETKNGGKFDYNSIQNMVYMDMVVSETLRLWPPVVGLDRICTKDYNLGKPNDKATEDYIVHKGEGIQLAVWPIHRDPRYFENPLKLDPERFSEENKHNIKPFTYMPFGLGPRNCIGSRFALCEVKVLMYQLLRAMEVIPGPKTKRNPKLDPSALQLRLQGGHWIRLRPRKV